MSSDAVVVLAIGGLSLNATIASTWIVMALLCGASMLITRNLRPDVAPDRWRTALEVIVLGIQGQVEEVTGRADRHLLHFAGTLFLFIVTSNLLVVVPGFRAPTASLSTTTALALAVLGAVPLFSIARRGLAGYLHSFLEPSPFMLPFKLIGEFSRGVSLAVRLYGNIMSGAVIVAILLGIAPFFFPVLMDMLGLLTGVIQAYIFAVLATVYIASASTPPTATTEAPP